MKASKFTDSQKAFIIRQGDEGTAVAEICRKAGISQATYFNWKKKYSGMMPSEMRRLRELEEENNRLKRIVADLSLDKAARSRARAPSVVWPGRSSGRRTRAATCSRSAPRSPRLGRSCPPSPLARSELRLHEEADVPR